MDIPDSHIMVRSSGDIAEICSPLKKYFNITDFNYEKIGKDYSKIKLTSRSDWMQYYYKHKLYALGEYEIPFEHHQSGCKLTSAMSGEKIFKVAREDFNIDHGIVLVDKYDDYVELFWFGASRDNCNVTNFYLNNMDILRRFVLYFKEKASSLILKANQQKILIPTKSISSLQQNAIADSRNKANFLKEIKIQSFYLSGKYYYISLTEREFECAICLLKGKTAQTTGDYLGISSRTVETHLYDIKTKLCCKTKSEMVEALEKNGFGFYTNRDLLFY